ncbi:MAG: acyltransferase family protein [Asticcacaulis sp.]
MTVDTHPPATTRYHDLDAVRALALLLGVALHGVMSFMEPRIWVIADRSTDVGLDVLFYVIHMFRMTTFFVLAGFFARMMMQKKGVAHFVGNRLKRVGLPLVAFWPVAIAAIITFAILANMPAPGSAAASAPPPPPPTLATFPLTHLWFLYVLLLLYAGAVVIKLVTDVLHVGGFLGRVLDKAVGMLTKTDLITGVLMLPVFLRLLRQSAVADVDGHPDARRRLRAQHDGRGRLLDRLCLRLGG